MNLYGAGAFIRAGWGSFIVSYGAMGAMLRAPQGVSVDGSSVLLGSTATHEPIRIPKPIWARRKSLEATPNNPNLQGMTL
ncbi:MAG: hypothetical protein B6U76_02285 [Desulfurococcales archaeon ex4484_217_2]|nr:MAG: hypothetical protein B6U76_02285 [Desulfurococcales archaeon ex4484_217_2]